ncbi:hypothetical protein N7532_000965 [Penicillium argentinense]|uniref:Uncharacterized protein n=1 Tax=Penicillium argentinense TaxID=1131581 RepID=A0A9W9KL85_9EURO|nr:uncharacterized protein N7532_000965 [Penicillium argentinense]KAJ5110430.1 hypothetical protein N7532_000965 [Penicillium argentinense]
MSTTTTTAAAASSSCAVSWQIPTDDVACAGIISGNMTDAFDSCCKGDKPVKYNDDCNIYCLAQDQSREKLRSCLTSKSGDYTNVFCTGNNDTATATSKPTNTKDSSSTGTSTSTSTGTSTSSGAAIVSQPISKTGLGLVAMLFCSALAGVVA